MSRVQTDEGWWTLPGSAYHVLLKYRVHDELEESVYGTSDRWIYFDTHEEMYAAARDFLTVYGTFLGEVAP